MKWTKYKWRGSEFLLSEICKIHLAETGKGISADTMRSRLRTTGGCIDSALNYKHKKMGPTKHLCPDGEQRTNAQICKYLKITKHG